ncbi:MAG TPA: SxtJ family membrane protein [Stellaceae bacterium]
MTPREEVCRSSDRSFGFVFCAVSLVVALLPLVRGGEPRLWALAAAAAFFAVALIRPALLAPLNRLWFHFGLLFGRVTNPLIMGLVFFLVITPMAVIMRLRGKDPLRLRLDHEAKSYWIERTPPGPAPASMTNQF